ncbi:B3/B4 domain-containing protein [Micromonospora purpureochromogenes]|uniref:DNA/RNA-binding domain of Phe-tRNA-synthetase-like protein n=1 Tax=Micromonospora purpureochromogenes TaxID=47872 RepID=A0ABX2RKL9_9ACTN|nr:phenylalanine--tRNA ligase beta subunit-related protein [Micromonospora purpureochromogenes]NYF55874.1 DNA/RNA-binding domain of Phe-tRNA-synthetase-like protein [Micromonospora purpureochromogenes]
MRNTMTQLSEGADRLAVRVDDRVLTAVPDYVLGLIAVPAVEVVPEHPVVAALLTAAEDALHTARLDKAGVAELPGIAAWREAYRAVGVNPNRFPCAAESIARRVAKGDRLPRINSLVDLCNSISLGSALPVASCAVAGIADLVVRPADGTETHLPLGAPDEPERPEPGEVVYADADGWAHSRRWNWRQGHLVRTDLGRHRLLLTVEAAHPGGRADVEAALARLTAALDELTGAASPATARQQLVLDRAAATGVLFTAPVGAPSPGELGGVSLSPAGSPGRTRP